MTQAAPIRGSPWNLNCELTGPAAGTWLELIHVASQGPEETVIPSCSLHPCHCPGSIPFRNGALQSLPPSCVPPSFPSNQFSLAYACNSVSVAYSQRTLTHTYSFKNFGWDEEEKKDKH